MYGKDLASTGVGTLAVGSVAVTYPWIAAGAIAIVVLGGLTLRASYKLKGRGQSDA